MSKDKKHYEWSAGVGKRIKLSPTVVGQRFEMIRARDGKVTDKAVVEDAKSPRSPLHRHFPWNNRAAADKYRLMLAQHMIRNLVLVEVSGGQEQRVGAYVLTHRDGSAEYSTIGEVLSDDEMCERYVARFAAEIRQVMARFSAVKTLAPVFPVLNKVLSDIEQRRKKKRAA